MQSHTWANVKQSWRWEAIVVRNEAGKIIGSMALLIRKVPMFPCTIMYSPRGPVCDLEDRNTISQLLDGAKALAKKHRSFVLKIDTDTKADNTAYLDMMKGFGFTLAEDTQNFEAIQPRYVFRLDISGKTEDELLSFFHSKTRYNIRLAARKGVEVKLCGKEMLPTFHSIMMETGVRDGFVIRSEEYFAQLLDALGDTARLYMAFHEGKPIAGTLAVCYGNKTWYLYGASSNSYRNFMPNYALQWEMIKWGVEMHCDVYDFRGVSGDLSEDNPLYGLYKFKKGFNGEFTEFVGELNLVLRPTLFRMVNFAQRVFRNVRRSLFLLKHREKPEPKHTERSKSDDSSEGNEKKSD